MGGGAMRAAAKVAGITVANGVLRGITSDQYSVFSATRMVASSHSETAMVEGVKVVASQSQASVTMKSSEIEDWVIAGGKETILGDVDMMIPPKEVFSGSPTLHEAKEATSELAAALEKAYLSSFNSIRGDGSLVADHDTGLPILVSPAIVNKYCVTSENNIASTAIKAFRILHDSHAVQNVVASIACDPKVWKAVLDNRQLQEFLKSQGTCSVSSNMREPSEDVALEDSESQPDHIRLMDIVEKVKITVVDMMNNLSDYFHNLFCDEGADKKVCASSGRNSNAETVMETSLVGLAIMAIMVILVKRA
ncbi:hypothetical protein OROHE_012611 [Orobanche hederae]